MSSDVAIKVDHLSKCYQIYDNPQDRLKQSALPKIQRLFGRATRRYFREFWALKDISIVVKKGETVGIIGCNGSGKSTLLQLICGTLNPSDGQIQVNGKVAALLELGSGFNPEFTGRENVYINAALLGLSNAQINQRYSEIVKFADIREFIDQPVKTYSSGMMVRLAFSVIAHVDADILVIDEALAVGDAIFTQKCMRFIREFQKKGTLLIVSHDLAAVQNLCSRAIWLDRGLFRMSGSSKLVALDYLRFIFQESSENFELSEIKPRNNLPMETDHQLDHELAIDYGVKITVKDQIGLSGGWRTGMAEITEVKIERADGKDFSVFEGGERVNLKIFGQTFKDMDDPILGFLVRDRLGQDIFGENSLSFTDRCPIKICNGGKFECEFSFQLPMLPNGDYAVMASVAEGDLVNNIQHHWLNEALILHVSSSKVRWGLCGVVFNKIELRAV
jgi:lipopolysaccharide transport system ATP-binding protein